jgi:carbon-monoxide dehydrogenase iron sulfur subunit
MQRIQVREQFCINCHLCEIHCIVAHSSSGDIIQAFLKETPRPEARVRVDERQPASLPVRCQHCTDAPCIAACLTGAMHLDARTGAVVVDSQRCMGCWTCVLVCPYGAVFPDEARGIATKCDTCPDLDVPACVETCPNGALVIVEIEPA